MIAGSFVNAASLIAMRWASSIATSRPGEHGVREPFEDGAAWTGWAVTTIDAPNELAGPDGEEIMHEEAVDTLLSTALRMHGDVARQNGWVSN